VQLTAVAKDARGNVLSGRQVAWSSSDPAIVTVSSRGVATGAAAGRASVTAASEGRSATVEVTVGSSASARIVSLDVAPPRLQVVVNRTADLRVTARDARGNILSRRVEWTSSNPAVAAVAATGVVTGVSPGSATITARSEGVASLPVSVTVIGGGPAPPGVLQLLVERAWAYVSIGGLPRGQRTRLVDTLPAGVPLRLHLEREGYETIDTTVTLQSGEQRLVRILMTLKH